MAAKKKQNFFALYFRNFGIKQICDILMLIGAIILIVGLFTVNLVVTIGLGFYIAATLLAIYRSVKILAGKPNKRSPEYKSSVANIIIMALILGLAIFGFIWSIIS